MYIDTDGKDLLHAFDSVSEFISYATDAVTDLPFAHRKSRSTSKRSLEFTGTATYEDAVELAYKGYPKARKAGEPLRNAVVNTLSSVILKKKPVYEFVGESIDIPRYLSGMPDTFLCKREPNHGITEIGKTSRLVRIGVNLTYVYYTEGFEITNRGAAIVALIDLLESSGKQVEVNGFIGVAPTFTHQTTETTLNLLIPLKSAGSALDIDFMYFCLAHPAFLRRFGFSCLETYAESIRTRHGVPFGNYGIVGTPKSVVDSDIAFDRVIDTITFRDEASTKKWLVKVLKEQGAIDNDTDIS